MLNASLKFEDFITKNDIEQPRTPYEFIHWFKDKWEIVSKFEEPRKQGLLHKNILNKDKIVKPVEEELFALYILLQHKENEWFDARLTPIIGNQPFDVKIESNANIIPEFIEITGSDWNELTYYRMKHLVEHGVDNSVGDDAQEYSVSMLNKINQLNEAIKNKVNKGGYPNNTALLVSFEDREFMHNWKESDSQRINQMPIIQDPIWKKHFVKIYIIGFSGRTFLEM